MLTCQESEAGYPPQLEAFAGLLRGLGDDDLDMPTRCAGWRVRDVAVHVIGTLADVTAFTLDGLATSETHARWLGEREGLSGAELAEELEGLIKTAMDLLATFDDAAWNGPVPGPVPGTIGQGIEALYYDTYVHADDIRSALGQSTVTDPAALEASVHHIAFVLEDQGHEPLTLALDGVEEVKVGAGGKQITGDAHQFVLATTGRGDLSAFGLGPEANIYRES